MLNRFKPLLTPFTYSLRRITSTLALDAKGRTPLHKHLPMLKTPHEFQAYIDMHGEKTVTQQLLSVDDHGYLPIDPPNYISPKIQIQCDELMNSSKEILPLNAKADYSPYGNHSINPHEYANLYNLANVIINGARATITSPYLPWMDPTSKRAIEIHQRELKIDKLLSATNPKDDSDYFLRFAMLSAELGQGTSKAFASVGLYLLAKSNQFGQVDGTVYRCNASYFLRINDIFTGAGVICNPLKGDVYPIVELNAKLRIPVLRYIPANVEATYLTHFNPNYHKLQDCHEPINAGSLATTFGLFREAKLIKKNFEDSNQWNVTHSVARKR